MFCETDKDGAHNPRGLYTAVIGALTGAVSAATASQFSAAIIPLAAQSGVTAEAVALTESVKSATVVLAMFSAPEIMRRCGWRISFALGALTMLVPQILLPFVSSYPPLVLLKAVQGFSALLFPLILALIMEWSDEKDIGLTTSLFMGVFYAGGAAGGVVAGAVMSRWSWQFSFHALSVAMLITGAVFLLTVKSGRSAAGSGHEADGARDAYKTVLRRRETWFLILAFLPTIWTIQAIWADVIPFGMSIGYSENSVGGASGASAAAIVIAAVMSGKASDFFAGRMKTRLSGRVAVFSCGMLLIIIGVLMMVMTDVAPPAARSFNLAVFMLSFGAAWGLGSFYCILPELFNEEQTIAANGFIGGAADLAMPLSPALMAVLGIGMNLWDLAWLSCAAISFCGLFFAFRISPPWKNGQAYKNLP